MQFIKTKGACLVISNLFNKLFKKQKTDATPAEYVEYSAGKVFLDVKDNDVIKSYRIKLDSIQSFNRLVDMQKDIPKLIQDIEKDQSNVTKISKEIRKIIIMMMGEQAYKEIFNDEDKQDSYTFHLEVFQKIFIAALQFKNKRFDDIMNSGMINEIEKMMQL